MNRLVALLLAALAMLFGVAGGALAASPVTVSKATAMVSDPQSDTLPKAIPGSVLDYTVSVTNPSGGASNVNAIVYVDTISAKTMLYVRDLGLSGSGPVVFGPGGVAGIGGSNLTYTFTSLGSTTDGIEFSADNGVSWTYTPSADINGYDGQVTDIRIKPSGTQAVGSTFTMRYRVMVR